MINAYTIFTSTTTTITTRSSPVKNIHTSLALPPPSPLPPPPPPAATTTTTSYTTTHTTTTTTTTITTTTTHYARKHKDNMKGFPIPGCDRWGSQGPGRPGNTIIPVKLVSSPQV
ncbi:hypothetical protein E2C01_091850 [Portunus trituberculatus]|uniref:Uncharacterized protein n=1 Tax=Portunus trituberculatus TaxID=210409 RepID=A0A5B7JW69_PORTR|nr:hypothetical protein [Portunus trituberculatus]